MNICQNNESLKVLNVNVKIYFNYRVHGKDRKQIFRGLVGYHVIFWGATLKGTLIYLNQDREHNTYF